MNATNQHVIIEYPNGDRVTIPNATVTEIVEKDNHVEGVYHLGRVRVLVVSYSVKVGRWAGLR